MNFLSLFESPTVKKLIGVVSSFQRENPYPDYGVLYWNENTKSVIYNVGDGQEGDLNKLEADLKDVPGVAHAEVADECGRPEGFKKVWDQGEL
jgi:hypothetical protein